MQLYIRDYGVGAGARGSREKSTAEAGAQKNDLCPVNARTYVAVASNYFEQRPPCLGPTLKRACFMKFDQNQLQLNIYPKASARFEDPQAEALLGY